MPNWETVKVLSLGWGEVPGNCCPQPQASANNSSCLISCLLPRDNSSDCFPVRLEIIVYYIKKKSTLLRFKSHSNPLSCHCNVILLPFFFFRDPQVETLEHPSPSFLLVCTVQTYLDTVQMSPVTALN